MKVVTIHHAKTHLSKLLAEVEAGEDVVIARGAKPIVRLVREQGAAPEPKKQRKLGLLRGQISLGPAFFEPLPEDELKLWNGE